MQGCRTSHPMEQSECGSNIMIIRCHYCKTLVCYYSMTMIDPATGWCEEVKQIEEATADCCQKAMDDTWFSSYPRPKEIGIDNIGEFKGVPWWQHVLPKFNFQKHDSTKIWPMWCTNWSAEVWNNSADWEIIHACPPNVMKQSNKCENRDRAEHTYKVGDLVAKILTLWFWPWLL